MAAKKDDLVLCYDNDSNPCIVRVLADTTDTWIYSYYFIFGNYKYIHNINGIKVYQHITEEQLKDYQKHYMFKIGGLVKLNNSSYSKTIIGIDTEDSERTYRLDNESWYNHKDFTSYDDPNVNVLKPNTFVRVKSLNHVVKILFIGEEFCEVEYVWGTTSLYKTRIVPTDLENITDEDFLELQEQHGCQLKIGQKVLYKNVEDFIDAYDLKDNDYFLKKCNSWVNSYELNICVETEPESDNLKKIKDLEETIELLQQKLYQSNIELNHWKEMCKQEAIQEVRGKEVIEEVKPTVQMNRR